MTAASRYARKTDPHSSHSIILRWLGEGGGRRLLDVGAADGVLSRPLTERGWRVTAIERDPEAAAAGARLCDEMLVADLDRERPTLTVPLDVIVYADVLEHLVDPLGVLLALNRHLAPHGHAIASVPNVAHLWVRLLLLAGRWDYADRGILDRTHLRFFTERSLRGLVAAAGLRIERLAVTPVPLDEVVPRGWHRPWLTAMHAVQAVLARALPRLLGYQFVVLASRREPPHVTLPGCS
jgi:2-polyprenyl-3-methyl-5-hydroxy-6-metoxy-1,4-benzoquinol methylase